MNFSLNEISQTEKDEDRMIPLIRGVYDSQTYQSRDYYSGCQWLGYWGNSKWLCKGPQIKIDR